MHVGAGRPAFPTSDMASLYFIFVLGIKYFSSLPTNGADLCLIFGSLDRKCIMKKELMDEILCLKDLF